MPSMKASAIQLPETYARTMPAMAPAANRPMPPPPTEANREPAMIASLPGVATGADATTRQWHGGVLPKRRVMVPR